jgi:hypothetical protein
VSPIQLYAWVADDEHARAQAGVLALEPTELGLVWLTRHAQAHVPANLGPVHRGPHRYRVDIDPKSVHPWVAARGKIDISDYFRLEVAERARPERWWISHLPVVATHDPE